MIRGTTPKHTFKLPFDTSQIKEVNVMYAQYDQLLFKKERADCVLTGDTIEVTLSQEETLLFNENVHVQVQLKVLTVSGTVLATNVYVVDVGTVLDGEVLT